MIVGKVHGYEHLFMEHMETDHSHRLEEPVVDRSWVEVVAGEEDLRVADSERKMNSPEMRARTGYLSLAEHAVAPWAQATPWEEEEEDGEGGSECC